MQNKLVNRFNIACLLTLTTATSALACNGSHVLGMGGAGAVYTVSANTMQEGAFYVGVNAERVSNKKLTDATMVEAMQNGESHLHNIDAIDSYALSLSYGITDSLTLNTQLPYIVRSGIRAGEESEIHPHDNTKGTGDLSAILQYKLYDDVFKIAILGGVKLPTGKTDAKQEREVLEADLQPGSGSIDLFGGVALTKDFEDFSIHSNILYKQNNKGVDDSQLGDIFTYNAALSYKLVEHKHDTLRELNAQEDSGYGVNVFIELNGENAQKDSFAGVISDNTGHNVLFATTGLQLVTDAGYALFMTVSKPIYQDFNGIQNEVDYKASFGVGKSF